MRYYKLSIAAGPQGNQPVTYTSWSDSANANDPGALQIEFDIPVTTFATPAGAAEITVRGVGIQAVYQANNLNGAEAQLFGGFKPGLPLATKAAPQAGLLIKGKVLQAYGNWVGLDQAITVVIYPDVGTQADPANLVWQAPAGKPLDDAIKQTLTTAYPDSKVSISINENVVLAEADSAHFDTLSQFNQYLKQLSIGVFDPTGSKHYQGIQIVQKDTRLVVYDDTQSVNDSQEALASSGGTVNNFTAAQLAQALAAAQGAKQLDFDDLIGQPVWKDQFTIQLWLMMRGDIAIGDRILMPKTPQIQTTQGAFFYPTLRNQSTFNGIFTTNYMRHVGNFRSPEATAWMTTIEANPFNSASV